jgi:hypothetical protein
MCDMVRQEGDVALRGGIVDVFPPPLIRRSRVRCGLIFLATRSNLCAFLIPFPRDPGNLYLKRFCSGFGIALSRTEQRQTWLEQLDQDIAVQPWPSQAARICASDYGPANGFPEWNFSAPALWRTGPTQNTD